MKTYLSIGVLTLLGIVSASAQGGMPQEARDAIHDLLEAHATITREVTPTDDGYRATTTSTDAEVVKVLQKHVAQMEARMRKGLMVRRWDPAYVEFVEHYDDIEIAITNIANGVQVVARGKTEAAKSVARNHAGIISKLVENGMREAHKAHAAVLGNPAAEAKAEAEPDAVREKVCCQAVVGKDASPACCKKTEKQGACCPLPREEPKS